MERSVEASLLEDVALGHAAERRAFAHGLVPADLKSSQTLIVRADEIVSNAL